MKEIKKVNGKEYAIEDGVVLAPNGNKYVVWRGQIKPSEQAPKPIYDKVKGQIPSGYVWAGGCFMPSEVAEIAVNQRDKIIAEKEARKYNNVPGLEILEKAIEEMQKYQEELKCMMEDEYNDGVNPPVKPNGDIDDLKKQYPIAAAYIKAESWSLASHYAKSTAGSKAVVKIENGEDWESAIAEMEAEWSAHVDKHIWD